MGIRRHLLNMLRALKYANTANNLLIKKSGGGRVAGHEIMLGTPAIRNLIRENKVPQMYSAIQTGQQAGMQTMDQALMELVHRGLVSREEARGKAISKDQFL